MSMVTAVPWFWPSMVATGVVGGVVPVGIEVTVMDLPMKSMMPG